MLPAEIGRPKPVPDVKDRAHELLAMMDLTEFSTAYPGELSGGMRQRVVGAMALYFYLPPAGRGLETQVSTKILLGTLTFTDSPV